MDMNNAFPSKYLSSDDFLSGPVHAQIAGVRMEDVSPDNKPTENKPVVYFTGLKRGLVLNVTNNKVLCTLFSGESDNWTNQVVEIFIIDTEFGGEARKGIRVRGVQQPQPMGGPNAAPGQVSHAVAPPNYVPNSGPAPAPIGPAQPAGMEHTVDGDLPKFP